MGLDPFYCCAKFHDDRNSILGILVILFKKKIITISKLKFPKISMSQSGPTPPWYMSAVTKNQYSRTSSDLKTFPTSGHKPKCLWQKIKTQNTISRPKQQNFRFSRPLKCFFYFSYFSPLSRLHGSPVESQGHDLAFVKVIFSHYRCRHCN